MDISSKVETSKAGTSDARHGDFAQRMSVACTRSGAPALNHGRLKWVRDGLSSHDIDVTEETVRKWLGGRTLPRPPKLKALSRLLGVDQGWLYSGSSTSVFEDQAIQFDHEAAKPEAEDRGRAVLERIRQRLGGTVTIMPGVDLTDPTGEVWDAERD